ncbi:MAG: hypothetical protein N2234_09885, partial [Planctomycetota bacterium]|nr:hypothetical protein [Planctomycetota bacterium]
GTLLALGSSVGATADAASAAAALLLTPDSVDSIAKYSRSLILLREYENAVVALDEFLKRNPLLDDIKSLRKLQSLLSECAFTAALMRPPSLEVEYTKQPPVIDGLLEDEWRRAKAIELDSPKNVFPIQHKRFLTHRWFAKEDLSAKLYLMWDEKALYFLLDVLDQSQRPFDDSQQEEYKGDMLYLAIEDVLIYMGLMVPQPKKDSDKDEEKNKPKGKYMSLHKRDNSGFVYEGELPWEYLGQRGVRVPESGVKAGLQFRINFAVLDDDTGLGSEKTLNLAPGLLCGRRDCIWRGFIQNAFATAVLRK